jgi:hypothetical protein
MKIGCRQLANRPRELAVFRNWARNNQVNYNDGCKFRRKASDGKCSVPQNRVEQMKSIEVTVWIRLVLFRLSVYSFPTNRQSLPIKVR